MSAISAASKLRHRVARLGAWSATALLAPLVVGGVLLVAPHLFAEAHHHATPAVRSATAGTAGADGTASTEISLVSPWVGSEPTAGYTIVGSRLLTGHCIQGSFADGNPTALRCFASNSYIYDPCFANGDGSEVACPVTPWSDQINVLALPKPLGLTPNLSEKQVASHRAWGVQLGNGDRCAFLEGTGAPTVSGVRIDYQCGRGQIVGDVDRTGARWTADYLPEHATTTRTVPVEVAWF